MEKYALFTYESLKKTKCREFVPSRDEIEALISRQEMTSTVYCHGGGSCKITINSHTTAGEVRVVTEQLWHKISVSLYIPIPDSSVSTKLRKHSGLLYRSLLFGGGSCSPIPQCVRKKSLLYKLSLFCRELPNCSSLLQEELQEKLSNSVEALPD